MIQKSKACSVVGRAFVNVGAGKNRAVGRQVSYAIFRSQPTRLFVSKSSGVHETQYGGSAHDGYRNREESGGASGFKFGTGAIVAAAAGFGMMELRRQEAFQASEISGTQRLGSAEERFVLLEKLGEGGQAVVYKALDKKTKKKCAIKMTYKNHPQAVQLVSTEVDQLRAAGVHPNLVGLQGFFETPEAYILAMDLADGGALFERVLDLGHLTEALASDYMLQITQAIMHLHKRGLCHGDIKPENLLLTSDDPSANIKLCDFGMARQCGKEGFQVDYTVGTFDYWAPEIVRRQVVSVAIDMWALGVVVYVMLCGCNPFDPTAVATDSEILSNIANGKMDESNEIWVHLSPTCKDFIKGLLQVDPIKRLTAVQALQHPWMVDQATTKDLPAGHQHRLLGYQALAMLRATVKTLGLQSDLLFELADVSKTDYLDLKELAGLFSKLGLTLSEEALTAVTEIADTNGDGYMQRGEFGRLMRTEDERKKDRIHERQIRQLFHIFDENNDGVISPEELTHVLNLLGRRITVDEAKKIIIAATKKQKVVDSGLSYADFSIVMRSGVLQAKE